MRFLADLRLSARSFARAPGLLTSLLLTIAFGIGGNAAVVAFVGGLRSQQLPETDSRVLVSIGRGLTIAGYDALAARTDVFAATAAIRERGARVSIAGTRSSVPVADVSASFFDVLGIGAAIGTTGQVSALPSSDKGAADVVISNAMWRRELGAAKAVIGTPLSVDDREYTIAGVLPEWFEGAFDGRRVDVWLPLDRDALSATAPRAGEPLALIGRLNDGRTREDVDPAHTVEVAPYALADLDRRVHLDRIGALLSWASGLVLILACATVAGLLSSRASARLHETSVRLALGANRIGLVRQGLADSFVITAAGAVAGACLAFWTARTLPLLFFSDEADRLVFAVDPLWIAGAAAAGAAAVFLAGLSPLARIRPAAIVLVLRRDAGGLSDSSHRVRAVLVVAQMTVCCLLLIITGVLTSDLRAALRRGAATTVSHIVVAPMRIDRRWPDSALSRFAHAPGVESFAIASVAPTGRTGSQVFQIEPRVPAAGTLEVNTAVLSDDDLATKRLPPLSGRFFGARDRPRSCRAAIVTADAARRYFHDDAIGRALTGIDGQRIDVIGVVDGRALSDGAGRPAPDVLFYGSQMGMSAGAHDRERFRVPVPLPDRPLVSMDVNVVSAGYFDVFTTTLVDGRRFDGQEFAGTCRVAVLNVEAADRFFDGDAVGGALVAPDGDRIEIVGVVRTAPVTTLQTSVAPTAFLPIAQAFVPRVNAIARVTDAAGGPAAVADQMRSLPGGEAMSPAMTLEAYLAQRAMPAEKIATALVGVSGVMTVGLSLLGVYGVMADAVVRRRRDIALRRVLGAPSSTIVRQLVGSGMRLAGMGAAGGLVAFAAMRPWLASLGRDTAWPSALVVVGAPIVLGAIVAIASVLPARHALAVAPIAALREET